MLLSQASLRVGSAASSFRGNRDGLVLRRPRNMKKAVEVRASQKEGGLQTASSPLEAVSASPKRTLHGSTSANPVVYKGKAKIMKKMTFVDVIDRPADIADDLSELFGKRVKIQLVSTKTDPSTNEPIKSKDMEIPGWMAIETLVSYYREFDINFEVPEDFGVPGAIIVKNQHPNEFQLVSFKLVIPNQKEVAHYITDSWVYNTGKEEGRIFFLNQAYLPNDTPDSLKKLREKELKNLRGDGTGERKPSDRIYDYDIYNDLSFPVKGKDFLRPALGGNANLPYPRRMRTGRALTSANNDLYESNTDDAFYIPRDECFGRTKVSGFQATAVRSLFHGIQSKFTMKLWRFGVDKKEFDTEEEIKDLYIRGQEPAGINNVLPVCSDVEEKDQNPLVFLEVLTSGQLDKPTMYPMPRVLRDSDNAWRKNDEFAREFLAGLNPGIIKLVEKFPIKSSLEEFGCPVSAITAKHIEDKLDGLSVEEAVENKKLFVADYHDSFLPFLEKINGLKTAKSYATRALFFLTKEDTLKVLALELALPPKTPGGPLNARVFLPPTKRSSKVDYVWELAKAHVSNNDIAAHQVFSHFSKCHAVTEAAIIASNRCLSKMHPIMQLMAPHFKNTLEINRQARKILIGAGGQIETHFTPGRFSLEMGSANYRDTWTFESQALPNDLVARGMAVRVEGSDDLKLLIEDYPYAKDGLELWKAIKDWNKEYVDIFYKDDSVVKSDSELQTWFTELREEGHKDKKNEKGWPVLDSKKNLVEVLTTMQWIPSCQHAAVNFGQFDFAGYMPHHPTIMRRLIPEEGTPEWEVLVNQPDLTDAKTMKAAEKTAREATKKAEKAYMLSLANIDSTTTAMSVYELLSAHCPKEEYLGNWSDECVEHTYDKRVEGAYKNFKAKIDEVNKAIVKRNENVTLKNRYGAVEMSYELLYTKSGPGVTSRGVPNSITI